MPARLLRRYWPVVMLAIAVQIFIVTRPFDYLVNKVFVLDDTFYPMVVARNIAHGLGSTFDTITPANAYEPLMTLGMVPLFKIMPTQDHATTPLYIVLVVLAAINLINGYLIARGIYAITRNERAAVAGFAIWTLSFPVLNVVLNGLETALSLFFFLLCFTRYLERRIQGELPPVRFFIAQGILLGVGTLSRIDMVFLIAALGLDVGFWSYKNKGTWIRQWFTRVLVMGGCALAIMSPWFIFNVTHFGDFLPKAVAGYRMLVPMSYGFSTNPIPLRFYGFTAWQAIKLITFVSPALSLVRVFGILTHLWMEILGVITSVSIIIFGSRALWRRLRDEQKKYLSIASSVAGTYALMMVLSYVGIVVSVFFFARYFVPILACIIMIGVSLLFLALPQLERHMKKSTITLGVILVIMSLPYTATKLALGNYPLHRVARDLEAVIPKGEKLGVYQAGMIGYFSHMLVVNMDGKLNHAVIPYIQENKLDEYLKKENIHYVGDVMPELQTMFWPRLGISDPRKKFVEVYQDGFYAVYRRND